MTNSVLAANLASWIHAGIPDSERNIQLLDRAVWFQTPHTNQWDVIVALDSAGLNELSDQIVFKKGNSYELIIPSPSLQMKKSLRELGALRKQNLFGMQRSTEEPSLVPPCDLMMVPITNEAPERFRELATWMHGDLQGKEVEDLDDQIQSRIADPGCRQFWIDHDHSRVGTVSLHDARRSGLWKHGELEHGELSSGWCSALEIPTIGIYDLFVDERWRGRGLGTSALHWAMQSAAETGIESIFVLAVPELQAFYGSHGFRLIGQFERWVISRR